MMFLKSSLISINNIRSKALWALLLCLLFSKVGMSENWLRAYNNNNFATYSHASAILPNGVMIFSGANFIGDAVLISTTPRGEVRNSIALSNTQYIKDIVPTDDGNIFVCGVTDSSFNQGTNIFWMKLDQSLNIIWKEQASMQFNDVCESAIQHSNGNYYIVGYGSRTGNGLSDRDGVIMSINSSGQLVNYRKSTAFQADYFNNLLEIPNGDIIIIGSKQWQTAMDFLLIRFSPILEEISTKTFGGSSNDGGYNIVYNDNSIYVLGGTFSYGEGSYDVMFSKLDLDFNIEFTKTYGTTSSEFPTSLSLINGSEFIISGNVDTINNSDTTFVPTKTFFIKTDLNGNLITTYKFKLGSLINNINATSTTTSNEIVVSFNSSEISPTLVNSIVIIRTDSFKFGCCDYFEEIELVENDQNPANRLQSFNFNSNYTGSFLTSNTLLYPLTISKNCGPTRDTASVQATSFTFCKSDTVYFSSNNTISPHSLLWIFGDTLGSNNTDENTFFLFDSAGVYKVYYFANYECNSDTDSITITIVDEMLYDVSLDHSTICINRPITFEAESSNAQLISFRWDFGELDINNDTSLVATPSYTYTQPGNYKIYLHSTTKCGNKLDSISINVPPAEVASIDDIVVSYCKGSVVPFQSFYSVTPNNILWDFGDVTSPNNNATGVTSTHTYNKPGTYICTMIAEFSCNSDTDTIHVNIVDYFESPTNINFSGVCVNQPFYFEADNSLSTPTYFWEIQNSTGTTRYYSQNFNHTFTEEGAYTIMVSISDNNCHMGFDTLELNVAAFVEAEINYANDPCLINAILSPNENTENVLWVLSNGYTSTSKILVYSFPETGNYEVKLYTNPNSPCVDSISQTFYFVKENANGGIYYPDVISPNGDGVNDVFSIQNNTNNPCKLLSLKIYDRWGKIIHEVNQFEDFSWDGKNNGSPVIPGAYIAFLETENYSKSFVIHVVY